MKKGNHYVHGMTGTRLYYCWNSMWSRCLYKTVGSYRLYGGRGISVCKEWSTFEGFKKWALANGYKSNLTLDRKNNNRGYCPSNCRWSTPTKQALNRRKRSGTSSKYIGVSREENRWFASVRFRGKLVPIGRFGDEFSAAWARDHYIQRHRKYEGYTLNNLKDRRKRKTKVAVERRQSCART